MVTMKNNVIILSVLVLTFAQWGIAQTGNEETSKTAYIYADACLWEAKLVRNNVSYPVQSILTRSVTLSVNQITIGEAIRYACLATGLQYQMEKQGIIVTDLHGDCFDFTFQVFTIKPVFEQAVGNDVTDTKVKQYLESLGISFPSESKMRYMQDRRLLFVRHVPDELNKIEKALQLLGMLENKAFDYPPPLPPPEKDISYKQKLALVIPFLEVEDMPVGKVLLMIAAKSREIDPEHTGINLLLYDYRSISPVVFSQEGWQRYTDSLSAPEKKENQSK